MTDLARYHRQFLWLCMAVLLSLALSALLAVQNWRLQRATERVVATLAAANCDLKHQNEMIKLANEFLEYPSHWLLEDFKAEWATEAQRYHKACHAGAA